MNNHRVLLEQEHSERLLRYFGKLKAPSKYQVKGRPFDIKTLEKEPEESDVVEWQSDGKTI